MEDEMRCDICGETIGELEIEFGNVAEMFDPKGIYQSGASLIVHAECGLAKGLEVS